jgi:2-methylcitrate dehydratase PrpD
MSLQYCVAVFLLEGKALVEQFAEEKVSDSEVLELAKRVEILLDDEVEKVYPDRFANKVEILLRSGERFETRVDFAKGSSERPMSFEEVAEKFKSLAGRVIAERRIDAIVEAVEKFEKLDDIRELTRLLE